VLAAKSSVFTLFFSLYPPSALTLFRSIPKTCRSTTNDGCATTSFFSPFLSPPFFPLLLRPSPASPWALPPNYPKTKKERKAITKTSFFFFFSLYLLSPAHHRLLCFAPVKARSGRVVNRMNDPGCVFFSFFFFFFFPFSFFFSFRRGRCFYRKE